MYDFVYDIQYMYLIIMYFSTKLFFVINGHHGVLGNKVLKVTEFVISFILL